MLAESFDLTPAAIYVAGGLLTLLGAYALILDVQVKRKKLAAPESSPITPQPLVVRGERVFVENTEFEKKLLDLERRWEMRFVTIEQQWEKRLQVMDKYIHQSHHEARNHFEGLTMMAKNREEQSREEFNQVYERVNGIDAGLNKLIGGFEQVVGKVKDAAESAQVASVRAAEAAVRAEMAVKGGKA